MRATLKRTVAYLLAAALLVSCTISGLVLPAMAEDPVLYFEGGVVTVPAVYENEYDILSQLKAAEGYTINAANLQWSIADNQAVRFATVNNPYSGSRFAAVTMDGSTVKTVAATTSGSMSNWNMTGNWSFAHVQPTITVTDGVNTATAAVKWAYEQTPVYYDFENGQTLQHSTSHTLNNYITQEAEGNHALRVPTNMRVPTRIYNFTAWQPYSTYRLSFRYKNEGAGTGTYRISIVNAHNITLKDQNNATTVSSVANQTGWQTAEGTITTGAAPTLIHTYSLFFDRGTTSTNYVWIDDIKIELISSPATAITVKPEEPTVRKGSTKQFSFVTEPSNGTAGEVAWSVSDPTKATIDPETGLLTALADSGTVEVTVTSSFELTDSTTVHLAPEKVADPTVVFESDFEDGKEALSSHWKQVVTEDSNFEIVEDTADIRNHALKILPVSGRYFNFTERELEAGRTYAFSFKAKGDAISVYVVGGQAIPGGWHTFTPANPEKWETFILNLTIPDYLIHGSTNYVFALRNQVTNGVSYLDDVKLQLLPADAPVESLNFDFGRVTLSPGETASLNLTSVPADSDFSGMKWTSSNEAVAYTVPGKVTAVGAGTAVVTATAANGKTASIEVVVKRHEAIIKDATFESTNSAWHITGAAERVEEAGYGYTTAMKLPVESSIAYPLIGLESNTEYKLNVWQHLPNNTAVTKVTIANGQTVVYEEMLGKTQAWTNYTLGFTTGSITGDCTITFTNTATAAKNVVFLDNAVLYKVYGADDPISGDPNLVFGGDFEEALSSHWSTVVKGDADFQVLREENTASNHMLKVQPTASGRYFLFTDRELKAGRTYRLSFKLKGETLSVYANANQVTPGGWFEFQATDPNVWQEFSLDLTVPDFMIHQDVKYIFALRNRTQGDLYLDNVELRLLPADPAAEAIEFDYTRLNMKPGKVRDLKILSTPEDCDLSELVWISSNEDVAYVVPGKVYAVGTGTATITATANNGKVATAQVIVSEHGSFIADATFEDDTTSWTLNGESVKVEDAGYNYTTAVKVPKGSSVSHVISGLKSNTTYKLSFWWSAPTGETYADILLKNGETTVYQQAEAANKTVKWSLWTYEFTTGTITGDCTLTITGAGKKDYAFLDNVVLHEVFADQDPNQILFGDFEDVLSDEWTPVVNKTYSTVIKDPADPMNHVLELKPFYNDKGEEVSGYWFKNLENKIIPGRTYKITLRFKGEGVDLYAWPGKFAEPESLRAIGWENIRSKTPDEWVTFEALWTVDPQAIHMSDYVLAIKNQHEENVLVDDVEIRLVEPDAPVKALTFDRSTVALAPGRTQTLKLNNTPTVSDLSGLVWTSSNEQVAYVIPGQASVIGSGLAAVVTAVGAGETTITVTANNGVKATCKVTVNGTNALLQDITLNNTASTAWSLTGGAEKVEGKGHYYTTALNLPVGGKAEQAVNGLKPNARYQLYLSSSCFEYGAKNNLKVQIYNGDKLVLDDKTAINSAWTANKYEFATGESVDNYRVVFVNEAAEAKYAVSLDNIFIAEAVSDVDLIVTDFFWDNDPDSTAQVKPGTPLTFTVVVVNQGTEAVRSSQSFDIDILVDAKKVQSIPHTGALAAGELITVTGTVPWTATKGDHMLTAHVNASMKVLENNEDNNDLTYNLRVYDDVLSAPEQALKHGFNKLTFSDDFNSIDTIDVNASGAEGYHWYVTRQYGESDQVYGKDQDFYIENGVLTLQSIKSAWAHSISTTDTRKTSGFTYNKGLLEARVRLPYTSKDLNRLDKEVRNPGIWAFDAQTMWADVTGEYNTVGIETDWIEFKGTKYRNPKTMEKECSFHTVLHHREDTDGDEKQDYWASVGEEFYYTDGYVISGATADDMGDWHTLSWAWNTNIVEMYVDGRLINTFTYSDEGLPKPGASSKYAGVPVKDGTFAALNTQYNNIILGAQAEFKMEVDFIRVWQADGTMDPVTEEEKAVSDFADTYLTGKDGKLFNKVTIDNYETILKGEQTFLSFTEEQQAQIDKLIGGSYLKWVEEIYTAKSKAENFIPYYACEENGTPYKTVDATNAGWIATAKAEWEALTAFERALIDKLVSAQSGMSFTQMLEAALAFGVEEPGTDEPTDTPPTDEPTDTAADLTWLWITLGAVGAVLIAALVILLVVFKKRKAKA